MTIDTSGEWWIGSKPSDLNEYLVVLTKEDGISIDEFRLAKCDCGGDVFVLEADRDEGTARRTCVKCKKQHFLCDSEEYWEEVEPEEWKCVCHSNETNLGVGFVLRESGPGEKPDVKWLYVGCRCVKCGTLSCFVDWKINYGPSYHLIDQV